MALASAGVSTPLTAPAPAGPPARLSRSLRLPLTMSTELGVPPSGGRPKKVPQPIERAEPAVLAARNTVISSLKDLVPPSPQPEVSTPAFWAAHATTAARRAPPGRSMRR
ncbi:MAG: hypothetical protein A2V88_14985 [Elusimicrobia bacterium RBG_16_66_12]|nr:MAG: hypothetical protein A2V88_14985 [Elusimicrobia bacterium RBG_16_66_12]